MLNQAWFGILSDTCCIRLIVVVKQQKIMSRKTGGLEVDMGDEDDEEEEPKARWGVRKDMYYNADNADIEVSLSSQTSLVLSLNKLINNIIYSVYGSATIK